MLKVIFLIFCIWLSIPSHHCEIGDLAVKKENSLFLIRDQRDHCKDLLPEVNNCNQAYETIDGYCETKSEKIEQNCEEKFHKLTLQCNEAEKSIKENCQHRYGYMTSDCGKLLERLDRVCRIISSSYSKSCNMKYRRSDNECYKMYSKIAFKCNRIHERYNDFCHSSTKLNYWNGKYKDGEFDVNENEMELESIKKMSEMKDFFKEENISNFLKSLERQEKKISPKKSDLENLSSSEKRLNNMKKNRDDLKLKSIQKKILQQKSTTPKQSDDIDDDEETDTTKPIIKPASKPSSIKKPLKRVLTNDLKLMHNIKKTKETKEIVKKDLDSLQKSTALQLVDAYDDEEIKNSKPLHRPAVKTNSIKSSKKILKKDLKSADLLKNKKEVGLNSVLSQKRAAAPLFHGKTQFFRPAVKTNSMKSSKRILNKDLKLADLKNRKKVSLNSVISQKQAAPFFHGKTQFFRPAVKTNSMKSSKKDLKLADLKNREKVNLNSVLTQKQAAVPLFHGKTQFSKPTKKSLTHNYNIYDILNLP